MHPSITIWTDLKASVRRFVGTRIADSHAADDITQDVMLKLQSRASDLPPEDRLPAWVITVARNAVIDHLRACAVRDHVELPDAGIADGDGDGEPPEAGLGRCLQRMICHLPEPYQEAVRLADVEGLSQQEIADRMCISLSGAKSRVQRGRQELREMIHDCCTIEKDGRGNVMDYNATEQSGRYCAGEDGKPLCGR